MWGFCCASLCLLWLPFMMVTASPVTSQDGLGSLDPNNVTSLELDSLRSSNVTNLELGTAVAIDNRFDILIEHGEDKISGLQAFLASILVARELALFGFNKNHPVKIFHFQEAPEIWIRIRGRPIPLPLDPRPS